MARPPPSRHRHAESRQVGAQNAQSTRSSASHRLPNTNDAGLQPPADAAEADAAEADAAEADATEPDVASSAMGSSRLPQKSSSAPAAASAADEAERSLGSLSRAEPGSRSGRSGQSALHRPRLRRRRRRRCRPSRACGARQELPPRCIGKQHHLLLIARRAVRGRSARSRCRHLDHLHSLIVRVPPGRRGIL